jgi:hypothetical protein
MNALSTKICKSCGISKDITEYSKRQKSRDGLQPQCKTCNKVTNKDFRHKNVDYWSYETGYFSDRQKWQYIAEWQRADKSIKVYKIVLPDGRVYIGSTKMHLGHRLSTHIKDFIYWKEGKKRYVIPKLSEFFNTWSDYKELRQYLTDNTYVLEETFGSRTKQYKREQWWIERYTHDKIELLNVNKACVK